MYFPVTYYHQHISRRLGYTCRLCACNDEVVSKKSYAALKVPPYLAPYLIPI
jgi:hypothetical protein